MSKQHVDATFDVIVIGGGHAGTEAALAAARVGAHTLLLTDNIETLGQMSCNPSIGGIGKGHLVREIDALGGAMAIAADKSGIHFRTLNGSKGPAVRATRVQADRQLYKQAIRSILENQVNLKIFQQSVDDLIVENNVVIGVVTQIGLRFHAAAVVLTTGTFLGGLIHIGLQNYSGGRAGDKAANHLSQRLRTLPLQVGRLKTGTPPRIDGKSIDFEKLTFQPSENPQPIFSLIGKREWHPPQVHCFITHTNENTHEIIRKHLHESPMYAGVIEGVGPRYCPSIEDKIVRFATKSAHQIFLEPEGLNTHEIYPNGISTSLPFHAQLAIVRSMQGLENAHLTRPGYAIEYDYFDPRDLQPSLENKYLAGLFFAGQINGTTGYEEAAAQGLLAGLNAARKAMQLPSWTPTRDQAYLGVLIDDLISRGVTEPYRMFTSRAEYRLSLREDNADLRLTAIAYELGLVNAERWQQFQIKKQAIIDEQQRLQQLWVRPQTTLADAIAPYLQQPLVRETRVSELIARPGISYETLMQFIELGPGVDNVFVAQQIEIQAKYAGYLVRQDQEIAKQQRYEQWPIPKNFSYEIIHSLSTEVREKLIRVKPETVGAAGRIPGVTPAAISLILVYLKKYSQTSVESEH